LSKLHTKKTPNYCRRLLKAIDSDAVFVSSRKGESANVVQSKEYVELASSDVSG